MDLYSDASDILSKYQLVLMVLYGAWDQIRIFILESIPGLIRRIQCVWPNNMDGELVANPQSIAFAQIFCRRDGELWALDTNGNYLVSLLQNAVAC